MKYALIIFETPDAMATRNDPQRAPAYWAGYTAYSRALVEAGVMAGGAGLEPPHTATSQRLVGGERIVQDGPFADTKELLGGFYIVDVPDLNAALEWAARCPGASTGCVEVRPLMPPPPTTP